MQSISDFITHWKASQGSERANYAMFLTDLADVLELDRPLPATADSTNDHYRFERPVDTAQVGTTAKGYIDLYKRGCFVLETKQGVNGKTADPDQMTLPSIDPVARRGHGVRGTRAWDKMMDRAKGQADNYARGVSRDDGWPPFLIVCDVGHVFEIYSDFSGQGHGYTQFPDGNSFRVFMDDLERPEIQDMFRAIWTDPASLDPSRTAAKVTREIADQLAALGKSFEGQGHKPDTVASFLMRCLFSMFAEDVNLIPHDSFTSLLRDMSQDPDNAHHALGSLWETMNTGGFSPILKSKVLRFNGGLFADADALPMDSAQIALLIGAAAKDWRAVEPAIFGTLLERALDKRQRHKLGAHYTPRAYVERLVVPTVIEPLRADWEVARLTAVRLADQGKLDEARAAVTAFHRQLCDTRVLDPACGSGNFLYVALELMKRLEGEVTSMLDELGVDQDALSLQSFTVDPHQFLGLEVNPWAARVAEIVLWIGYLQWHFRTHGKAAPAEPVLRDFHNIENRDAVLDHGGTTPRMDGETPVTRWDGITTKPHSVTGEDVPDDTARTPVLDFAKPKPAKWPEAEFIVGNPPFIGASRMRETLGDGYAEALWAAYPKMPRSADFVMFWWEKAALLARAYMPRKGAGLRRFGFITTNSLRQTFNRKVLEPHLGDAKKPLSLLFAIPDHPWVDAGEGAAVRIAMTVASYGRANGRLWSVREELKGQTEDEGRVVRFDREKGKVFANLRTGADVAGAKALRANDGISSPGVKLHGAGFIVTPERAEQLGLGTIPGLENHIRPYRNGRDLMATPRGVMVIDLFVLTEEDVRQWFPAVFQHVYDAVKPERDQNNRESYKRNWWIFGEPRKDLRPALEGLPRYIATVETTKHRVFQFLHAKTLPDNMLIAIGSDDAAYLAVLSSKIHVTWALAAGARLGIGNDPRYNKSRCFDPFPFPDLSDNQRSTLRALGEELDAHRKDRQAQHPKLTLTQMYNVLEKLRAGDRIEGKDKEIYDQGLIGLLRDIHDRIDTAVAQAYGWPADLSDDNILHHLVDLNATRAAEEARGHVRWLRPAYQNPTGASAAATSGKLDLGDAPLAAAAKVPWPKDMTAQFAAVRDALSDLGTATPEQIARTFTRGRATTVAPLLDTMVTLGTAAATPEGYRALR